MKKYKIHFRKWGTNKYPIVSIMEYVYYPLERQYRGKYIYGTATNYTINDIIFDNFVNDLKQLHIKTDLSFKVSAIVMKKYENSRQAGPVAVLSCNRTLKNHNEINNVKIDPNLFD